MSAEREVPVSRIWLLGCPAALGLALPALATAALHYTVSVDPPLTRIDVQVCLPEPPPRALVGSDSRSRRLLETATLVRDEQHTPLDTAAGIMDLRAARPGDCVEYRVRIEPASGGQRDGLRVVDGAIVGPSSAWLWRPPEFSEAATMEFALPAGMDVSAPWPENADFQYRITDTPPTWRDQLAIGRLARIDVPVQGGQLRLALIGRLGEQDPERFHIWLAEAASAVSGLYGRFPQPDAQVVLLPATRATGPVPWGQVLRGGAPAVSFVVNPQRPLAEFRADWTAVHEFSHLLLPFVSRRDAWVSEGFASYYQNVLRSRAGMVEPVDAWSKLWAGFDRGRAATDGRLTLAEATRDMYGPNLMRVYWAGAALALDADIELRRHAPSGHGLDDVLDALGRCCLEAGNLWTGERLFRKLDSLAGTDFLQAMYSRYARSREFPDVDAMFRQLGIQTNGAAVYLSSEPVEAALRAELDGSDRLTSAVPRTAAAQESGYLKDRPDP